MFDEHGRGGCVVGRFTNLAEISIKLTGGGTIVWFVLLCIRALLVMIVSYAASRRGESAMLTLSVHSFLVENN